MAISFNKIHCALSFAVALLWILAGSTSPSFAGPFEGRVSIFEHDGRLMEEDSGAEFDGEVPQIRKQVPSLDATVQKTEKPPAWIEGNVYSNEKLYMYSFWYIPVVKKEIKWRIPENKRTTLGLRESITKYWRGGKVEGRCQVEVIPLEESGRFRFVAKSGSGPRGYLENVGVNSRGFPLYRFWFEETEESKETEVPQ